jgi:zinc/manganese transport system substrate-binding protein
MKKIAILIFGCLGIFISNAAVAKLRIVTTTQDLAAIAKAVGGDAVHIDALTPGTRDPHFAEARPSMIRQVYRADIVMLVGADLEVGWLPAVLRSARNRKVLPGQPGYLDLSKHVKLLGVAKQSVDRSMGDVHAAGNPHYWLDPHNGVLMAQAMADRMASLDKVNAQKYQNNAQQFVSRLEHKITEWQQAMQPYRNLKVISYHTSFNYLANAFGLSVRAQIEPLPGISPSAAHLAQLIQLIRQQNITSLLVEPYYEQRSANMLHDKTGIAIHVIPQSVGARADITTYFDLFDAIVNEIKSTG